MRIHLYLLIFLVFLSCENTNSERLYTAITSVNVIDPIDGLLENQDVFIYKERIKKIVAHNKDPFLPESMIIDGKNKFLIPGLWDAHVHFAFDEALSNSMFDLFLLYGITSVRDTGGKMNLVKRWKEMSVNAPTTLPRVMIAGPLLDGHPNVYDGGDEDHPELSVGLKTVQDVDHELRELASEKVDFFKAYEMLTPEQFSTITEYAEEAGLKVTGHVPLSMDVISASNAGLNSMEHMRNLEISCAENWEELLAERKKLLENQDAHSGAVLRTNIHGSQRQRALENYSEEVADKVLTALKENDTWQIPTITLNNLFTSPYYAREDWQESYNLLPATVRKEWLANSASLMESGIPEFRKTYEPWMINMLRLIHEKEIPIMAGTDTPIAFLMPGLSLHEELVILNKTGLSPLETLQTATSNPALYFDMSQELGRLKEGYIADLVILDDNPLEDISNTQKVVGVLKHGKLLDVKSLREKLLKEGQSVN